MATYVDVYSNVHGVKWIIVYTDSSVEYSAGYPNYEECARSVERLLANARITKINIFEVEMYGHKPTKNVL